MTPEEIRQEVRAGSLRSSRRLTQANKAGQRAQKRLRFRTDGSTSSVTPDNILDDSDDDDFVTNSSRRSRRTTTRRRLRGVGEGDRNGKIFLEVDDDDRTDDGDILTIHSKGEPEYKSIEPSKDIKPPVESSKKSPSQSEAVPGLTAEDIDAAKALVALSRESAEILNSLDDELINRQNSSSDV
ncbi:MAG: hypothetical protein Q9227_000078 [Pyrenula ochraceoflavens]